MKSLVLEIERIQLIRKKCKAKEMFCRQCDEIEDFVKLDDVTDLFSTTKSKLFEFIQTRSIHYLENSSGEILLCINSFLSCIHTNKKLKPIKLVQGGKQ